MGGGFEKLLLKSEQACTRMVDLRDRCIHPASKEPYIRSCSGGRQSSPENSKVRAPLRSSNPFPSFFFFFFCGPFRVRVCDILTALERAGSIDKVSQAGYSHAFVVEFASEEDRRYYLEEDAAHLELKKSLKPLLERVGVVDYTPGVY